MDGVIDGKLFSCLHRYHHPMLLPNFSEFVLWLHVCMPLLIKWHVWQSNIQVYIFENTWIFYILVFDNIAKYPKIGYL